MLAAVQAAAAHPQITIAETGDGTITKAVNDTIFRDLRRAYLRQWSGLVEQAQRAGVLAAGVPPPVVRDLLLGALNSAGRAELSVAHLAVRDMPGSGTSAELLDAAGLSAGHIADAARDLAR